MAINPDVFKAILAMDAYNRGYVLICDRKTAIIVTILLLFFGFPSAIRTRTHPYKVSAA